MAIAAMLAALKAGRTYVPLDPDFPAERLAFMSDDCRPRVILTDGRFVDRARALAGNHAAVINLDEPAGPTDDSDLGIDAPPDLPAYILYTSGSTGRPKGVMQTQRNLLHFVKSYTSSLGIQADDRLTLLYSFSFSAALMDIYGGLLTGATVLPHSVKEHGTCRPFQLARRPPHQRVPLGPHRIPSPPANARSRATPGDDPRNRPRR